MTVRIVDPTPDPKVEKFVSCTKGCGARLAYVPNDVKSYNGRDYSGGADGYEWIDCPQCGKKVVIKSW